MCTPPAHTLSHHHFVSAGVGPQASSASQHAPATLGTCPEAQDEGKETSPTAAIEATGNFGQADSIGIHYDCGVTQILGSSDSGLVDFF